MNLCWQTNVSAFSYAVYVGHSVSSKEQASFNFMASVTICRDFEAPQNKVSHYLPKTNIMASGPITSWEIDGETVETVSDFIILGSKITADGDCSHEIKRWSLLGRKAMTNLDSIFKSRDIALPAKVHLVKALVFPVVMYGCESWTIKKTEH